MKKILSRKSMISVLVLILGMGNVWGQTLLSNFTDYDQVGQSWSSYPLGSNPLGNGFTINKSGCYMVSAAMLLKYSGLNVTPVEVNNWLATTSNNSYSQQKVTQYPGCTFLTNESSATFNAYTLKSNIDNGNPIIVGVTNHFMVIKGYINNGTQMSDFIVSNPALNYDTYLSYYNGNVTQPVAKYTTILRYYFFTNFNQNKILNQSLPIYAGTIQNPKNLNIYFKSSGSSSFSVPYFNIKIPGGPLVTIPGSQISSLPSRTVGGITWLHFNVNLSTIANNPNFTNNGYRCDVGFDVVSGGTTTHYHGDKQLYFLNPDVLTDIGSANDKWYDQYVKAGVDYGLFRGISPSTTMQSVSFNPSQNLTRAQAASVIVTAGVKLGLLNIDISGNTFSDVGPGHPYFKYIQTLKNYNISTPSNNVFHGEDTDYIDQAGFCKWVALALDITTADINQSHHGILPTISYTYPNDPSLASYINILAKTPSIRVESNLSGELIIEPIFSAYDFSSFTSSTSYPPTYVCDGNVARCDMAKIITLAYEMKKDIVTNPQGIIEEIVFEAKVLHTPDEFITYGDKFHNAAITASSGPGSINQQNYTIASGGSITLIYSAGSLPQHYYWSLLKNGATLTSNNADHSSVTFTAPVVTTPTQWKLYTYTANNKGKAKETIITINVGGAVNTNIPVPTNLQLNSYAQGSVYIEWETVGYGITDYEVEYSQDPSFVYGTVNHTVNSNFLTANWEPTGLPEGVYYVKVRSVNSAGGNSAWSQTASITLNSNTQPYVSTVTPANGATITGNSVTLNFGATGGNAPLIYTVYFSAWNPQGNPPVAVNLSTPSYTVNNLTPNNTYFWAVKVVDADGDEYITNNFSVNTSPSTTVPAGSVVIENGAASTNSISVNLNITSTAFNNGTISGMRFSNDGITWPDYWEQYNANRPAWSLVGYGGTSTPGNKVVYAQFKDNSGNISPTYSDNITLASGSKGIFIVRDKTFESLRAANEYAAAGDIIYATAGYFDLTSEINPSSYLPYSSGVGVGLKNGVSLVGEGAEKTTLFWDGNSAMTGGLGCAGNNVIQGLTLTVSVNPSYSRTTLLLHGASNVTIKNCILSNGYNAIEGTGLGGSSDPSNITIQNNLIMNNSSRAIRILNCNGLNIYNNTINNNGYSCVQVGDCSDLSIKNNIVSNNKAEAIYIYDYSSIDFKNNNVFNNRFSASSPVENYASGNFPDQTSINGNISVEPLFVNSNSYNFKLNTGSPCINSGITVGSPYFGSAPEIGAYETGGSGSIILNSNVSTSFLITKPDGTQQTYANGETVSNIPQGIYGIYPQAKAGYYRPYDGFVYLNINEVKSYNGLYILDTQGPEAEVHLNGNAYSTQSPYVSVFCDVVDKVNGLENGQMQFSNDGIVWSTPEPVKNKKLLWDLSGGDVSNLSAGTKIVYAKFSDQNGYWSDAVTNQIEYIPSGKVKIIEPNNNVSNLDFRNDILNALPGDILLLKEGTHTIFGGSITFPEGITLQGTSRYNSIARNASSININNGYKFDNLKFYCSGIQNFFAGNSNGSLKSVISNCVSDHQSIQLSGHFNLTVANNVFRDASQDGGLFKVYSNDAFNKIMFANNIFDARINTSSLNTELGIYFSGLCCSNKFKINNNIFIGFNLGTETGVYMGGAVLYANSSNTVGDLSISNNNFYDCTYKIKKYNGTDISKDQFSYGFNPDFNADYILPNNSPLLNSGTLDLLYKDHNGSTNDIGITGGIYYNTPPVVAVTTNETGYNQFKFTANATDGQTPVNNLQYRWDFDNDGIMDTPFLLSNEINQTISGSNQQVTCYVFDELFAIGYQTIQAPTPSDVALSIAQQNPSAICAGSTSPFQIAATGNFNQGCEFNVILSDPSGDFTNPSFSQTLTSQPNGVIDITFEYGLPSSMDYQMKIISTNPSHASTAININILSTPQSSVSIAASSEIICPGQSVTFTATSVSGGSNPVYTWKKNSETIGTDSDHFTTSMITSDDVIWVEMIPDETCAGPLASFSPPLSVEVIALDELFIQAIDNVLAASTDQDIQWLLNGEPIPGATFQFYEATQTGFYQFQTTVDGCTQTSDIFSLTQLELFVEKPDIKEIVKVYPNPFEDYIHISMESDFVESVRLLDMQGRTLLQENPHINNYELNVHEISPAVYFLIVSVGDRQQTFKVVKNK